MVELEAVEILVGAARTDPDAPRLADLAEAMFRGPLAVGREVRAEQIAMARAVADAIESGPSARLAVEAKTGTGKTLGYLVPAVLAVLRANAAGKTGARVVVSTSGIPLQRQIVEKDVPALASAMGIPISAGILKGRGNYACWSAIDDLSLVGDQEGDEARRIADWMRSGGSGDREDLPWQPRRWGSVSVSGEDCLGSSCSRLGDCVSERARRDVMAAKVLVMNHAYFALAGGKWLSDGPVALIVDEAHDVEDALRNAGSGQVTRGQADQWRRLVYRLTGESDLAGEVHDAILSVIGAGVEAAGGSGPSGRATFRLRQGWWTGDPKPGSPLALAAARLEDLVEGEQDAAAEAKIKRAQRGLRKLAARMNRIAEVPEGSCAWVERTDRADVLRTAPLDAVLPDRPVPTILCSATLGAGVPADAARAIGVTAKELVLPHPWPVDRMGVCVVPKGPDPRDPRWASWCDDVAVDFVRRCGGGVLVVASSWRRAEALARVLRQAVPWTVRFQGDAGRAELVDWFRSDVDGCLVGTASFRQGLDVSGRACRGVLIDRVPFPQPGDPLEEAIGERLADPFRERSVPLAAQALQQTVGRLLRSVDDRGAVCVLDPRLVDAPWARRLRLAVAPIRISRDLDDVDRVLRGEMPAGAVEERGASRITRSVRSVRS